MKFTHHLRETHGRQIGLITFAFGILLAGMILVVANGLWQNHRLQVELKSVTQDHGQRLQLASDLQGRSAQIRCHSGHATRS